MRGFVWHHLFFNWMPGSHREKAQNTPPTRIVTVASWICIIHVCRFITRLMRTHWLLARGKGTPRCRDVSAEQNTTRSKRVHRHNTVEQAWSFFIYFVTCLTGFPSLSLLSLPLLLSLYLFACLSFIQNVSFYECSIKFALSHTAIFLSLCYSFWTWECEIVWTLEKFSHTIIFSQNV